MTMIDILSSGLSAYATFQNVLELSVLPIISTEYSSFQSLKTTFIFYDTIKVEFDPYKARSDQDKLHTLVLSSIQVQESCIKSKCEVLAVFSNWGLIFFYQSGPREARIDTEVKMIRDSWSPLPCPSLFQMTILWAAVRQRSVIIIRHSALSV